MPDAERLGVDQHDGQACARLGAVHPGVIGAALDHHVAGAQVTLLSSMSISISPSRHEM